MEALRLMTGTPTRNYEEIDRLLSCPICLEVFNKPVVILPCQHNLCRKCANDVFQNRGTPMGSGGRFRCPTCRYEVVLDRHGVYGLQRNLLVENIIDMYQSEGRKPTFKKVETLMCEDHEEERVNIYCITCQKPTCSLCKVFGQHQDCEVAPMEKVYKEQKKEISDAIALLVSGNDRLQAIISQTEELGKFAESNGRKVKTDLCEAFDKLYAVLEERKTSMMSKITADVQERNQVLQEMLKNYGQQLEGASKLMEASLGLLEERSIPQFLTLSREMIEKVVDTARSSEVRKPPFNIQNMDEFYVDFDSQEALLYKLDFLPVREDDSVSMKRSRSESESRETVVESEVDDDYDATTEEAHESDDVTTTSVASRSDIASLSGMRSSTDATESTYSRDLHSREENHQQSEGSVASESESRRCTVEEVPPVIKKGKWYDLYVRQLPSPISMTGFSAPMESSVHMKVVIPADVATTETEEDLKKDNVEDNPTEDASNTDSEDAELAELLAPVASLRQRWAVQRAGSTGSRNFSPSRSPPRFRSRRLAWRSESPPNLSPVSSPLSFDRNNRVYDSPLSTINFASSRTSSPVSSRRNSRSLAGSPVGLSNRRGSASSPLDRDTLPALLTTTQRGRQQTAQRSDSPTSNQTRRPRMYCTHRRRTWSHLLDKR